MVVRGTVRTVVVRRVHPPGTPKPENHEILRESSKSWNFSENHGISQNQKSWISQKIMKFSENRSNTRAHGPPPLAPGHTDHHTGTRTPTRRHADTDTDTETCRYRHRHGDNTVRQQTPTRRQHSQTLKNQHCHYQALNNQHCHCQTPKPSLSDTKHVTVRHQNRHS